MTDLREVATLRFSGSGEKAWAYATDEQLTTISSSGGTETQTDSTFATSNDLTALAAVIDALTGWDMTVESAYAAWPTADVPAQVIGDCEGRDGPLRMFTELVADVNPDVDRGVLWKGCGCFDRGVDYRVKYTAGYATVPEDVQEAVTQAVAWAFYFQRESQVQISGVTGSSGDAQTRWIWEKVPSRLKQLLQRRRSLTGF